MQASANQTPLTAEQQQAQAEAMKRMQAIMSKPRLSVIFRGRTGSGKTRCAVMLTEFIQAIRRLEDHSFASIYFDFENAARFHYNPQNPPFLIEDASAYGYSADEAVAQLRFYRQTFPNLGTFVFDSVSSLRDHTRLKVTSRPNPLPLEWNIIKNRVDGVFIEGRSSGVFICTQLIKDSTDFNFSKKTARKIAHKVEGGEDFDKHQDYIWHLTANAYEHPEYGLITEERLYELIQARDHNRQTLIDYAEFHGFKRQRFVAFPIKVRGSDQKDSEPRSVDNRFILDMAMQACGKQYSPQVKQIIETIKDGYNGLNGQALYEAILQNYQGLTPLDQTILYLRYAYVIYNSFDTNTNVGWN